MATQLSRIEQNTLAIMEAQKRLAIEMGRRFDELAARIDACHMEMMERFDKVDEKLSDIECKLDGPPPDEEVAQMSVTVGEPVSKE